MAGSKVILLVTCTILLRQATGVSVQTSKGVVNGFHVDFGTNTSQLYYGSADVFLGIPYVEAPIGSRRFQRPQEKAAWNSPLDATSYAPQCPQPPNSLGGPPINSSEDCLYLNVFSPNASSSAKYPVMVWIHGGALVTGNALLYGVKGAVRNLVSRGVVVVTLQYRLGLLGFFTTQTEDFPANLGMLDQVMALKWVKNEIAAFGGDPSQITIFGESAGGASVSAHTYSPLSKGLFHKAIMESGVALLGMDGTFGFKHLSELRANQLCNFSSNQWHAGNFAPLKTCLQNMPYDKFIALELNNPLGWNIVKDGKFLPGWPQDMAASRTNIPVMIGTNRDEWALWELTDLLSGTTTISDYTKNYFEQQMGQFTKFYGNNQSLIMSLIDKVYVDQILPSPDPVHDNLAWFETISQVISEAFFIATSAREVDLWHSVTRNPNVYLYEFVYPTNAFRLCFNLTWTPVYHASDLFYIWMQDTLWEGNPLVSADDFAVANIFGQTWTDFAKNGVSKWDPVNNDSPYQYMEISTTTAMKQSYRETARVFWNEVVPGIVGVYPRDPQNEQSTTTLPSTTTTTPPSTTTSPLPKSSGSSKIAMNCLMVILAVLLANPWSSMTN